MRRSLISLGVVLAGCPGTRTAGTPGCPADRTVIITSQDEVARYVPCESLASLKIRTGAPIDLTPLHNLETITGNLEVGPTIGMDELKLTDLQSVGGTIQVASNNSIHGVFLPRLERAGRIEIENNASLATIALPRLADVLGTLIVNGNSLLELIDISALVVVGNDLVISDNPALTLIEGGKLTGAQDVRIEHNTLLPQDVVDGVRAKTPTE